MGKELYDTQPIFKATLNECEEILKEHMDESLLSILFPEDDSSTLINETQYAQPASP